MTLVHRLWNRVREMLSNIVLAVLARLFPETEDD